VLQQEPGPMAETLRSVHQRGQGILHGLREAGQSIRQDAALDRAYRRFKEASWRWVSSNLDQGGD
jgi:hypothetical protein